MNEQPKVLIIDDDDIAVMLSVRVLRRVGFEAGDLIARNGQAALDLLAAHESPDVILLDIDMPGMDGFAFLEHYRQLPDDRRRRSIVTLSSSMLESERSASLADVHVLQFVEKPLSADKAAAILAALRGA